MSNRGRTHTRWMNLTAIAVAIVLFVIVNILANELLRTERIDLTENRIYTLSDGTRSMLSDLAEPITLRFFYSEEMANGYPIIQSYGNRLKGLLAQYQLISDGQVHVEYINPKVFSEEEDLAVALGIAGLSVDNSGNKLYFGLAASNTTDDRIVIPFFDPDKAPFIEYELTRMIHDLSNPQKLTIGLMTWLPLQGGGGTMFDVQGPWVIYEEMQESFDVKVLDKDSISIPEEVDVLMIVHPDEGVPEDTLYAIDQFILRGGRALIFTDPYTKMDGIQHPASSLETLYHAWGIDMPKEEAVADPQYAIRVRNDEQRGSVLSTISNPVWLALQQENFNSSEIVSANLETMRFIVSGHFVPKAAEGEDASQVTMTPLVLSGPQAAKVPTTNLMFNFDPAQFMGEAVPLQGRAVMAARLSGPARTAFPDRDGAKHLASSESDINVVVIGDVDMLRDGFWVNKQNFMGKTILIPTANNGSFVLNILDYLSGEGGLIGLRSRMAADRPFERVEAMRLKAEARFRQREDELKTRLADLERRLQQLSAGDGGESETGEVLLSPGQQEELNRFREEMLTTRKELRSVQRSLREEIEALGTKVKLINIGLVPVLVLLLALIIPARLGMRRS